MKAKRATKTNCLKLTDIDLQQIGYNRYITYKQFRNIIHTKCFLCLYKGRDTIFTYNKKIDDNLNNNIIILSKTDFTQLLIVLFNNFLQYFCQNTRTLHPSVKNFNFKKFKIIATILLCCLTISFFFPSSRLLTSYVIIIYYLICILIKFFFVIYYSIKRDDINDYIDNKPNLAEIKSLPRYTILIPMFKENKATIMQSITAIQDLQYPKHLLDVKLVLEADDKITHSVLQDIHLPDYITPIWVPFFHPRTKPKACNFASLFAEGDVLVIFDAEDIPDKDQLLKAVYTFHQEKNTQILQGCLRFYNYRKNILTQCFNIEYTVWFKIFLKILAKWHITIPLGGTSNHIRYSFFEKYGYWDSYNVTEDLELSVIANINNEYIQHLQSDTLEWCVVDVKAFIKQRTRWIKGYFLTYLTNFSKIKRTKIHNLLFLDLCVGFNACSFLFFPYFVISCFFLPKSYVTYIVWIVQFFYYFSYITIYYSLITNMDVIFTKKTFIAFIIYPVYFILHFISAWKAFFEIFYKPFYWDKTNHEILT